MVGETYVSQYAGSEAKPWPWLFDLDGDGRTEVVVPETGPCTPKAAFRGLKLLDGPSGQTRWVRPMSPQTTADDPVEHLLEAPDLDGDGVRDLIAVSRFDGRNPPASPNEQRVRARARLRRCALRPGRPPALVLACGPDERQVRLYLDTPMVGPRAGRLAVLAVPLGGRNPDQPGGMGFAANFHPADRARPGGIDGAREKPGLGTGPRPPSPTWTATAWPISGARPRASSAPSAASRPRCGGRSACSHRPGRRISPGTPAIDRPPTSTATGSPIP